MRRLIALLVVIALVIAGFLLVPAARSLFEDTRDKLGKAAQITPTTVTADAEAPGHPAGNATDGLTNEYWGAPALGDTLTCAFAAPFRLVGVVVNSGVSTAAEEFRRAPRPTRVDLLITTTDGRTTTRAMTLDDRPGPQTLRMGIGNVTSVRVTIRAATGATPEQPIALGEIEFFRRT
ncbi:NADase-type glycan-binding domain-containing protein [Embleya sp. NPDC050154]|uniref:NADase-type glycan-binding domain-containing protein n=1 Tax=unclassified Embleya TaxID=2699296 RepID=UPI0037BCAD3A